MKNKMMRILSITVVALLVFAQAVSAHGNQNNQESQNNNQGQSMSRGQAMNQGQGNAYGTQTAPGQLKKVEDYSDFSQSRIQVNNGWVDTAQSAVIKDGTTLIPVRDVAEALGCTVLWYSPYAVIISPDEDMAIIFDMEDGEAYISEDPEDDLGDLEESDDPVEDIEDYIEDIDPEELTVEAGVINGSTFVPIRFIAETFGLDVDYDSESCSIYINDRHHTSADDMPSMTPYTVQYDEGDLDVDDDYLDDDGNLLIEIDLNDWEFVEIDDLDEDDEYEVNSAGDEVTIDEDYLEDLEDGTHTLEFIFENDDDEETSLVLRIKVVEVLPELSVTSLSFDEGDLDVDDDYLDDDGNLLIEIDLNDWEFVEIDDLDEDDEYEVNSAGDEVTIDEDYLEDLEDGTHKLAFIFENDDDEEITLYVKLRVED